MNYYVLNIASKLSNDVGTKSLMRCYMALPVLPAPHIQPVFEALVTMSPPFINYIREQWIEGNIFTVTDLSMSALSIGAQSTELVWILDFKQILLLLLLLLYLEWRHVQIMMWRDIIIA